MTSFSNKCNLIMARATSLISSLFNVASFSDVPFCQLQQLQCLYHVSTKAYLFSPLCTIGDNVQHECVGLSARHHGCIVS